MITVLDFEASGLDLPDSYPIEVGIAQIDHDDKITVWSSLIQRPSEWTHWNDQSEGVHGISRETIAEYGLPASDVALILNTTLGDGIALVDGHRYDSHWADRLYEAAGIERTWELASYDIAIFGDGHISQETLQRILTLKPRKTPPHRAGEDARLLAEMFLDARDIIAAEIPA